MIRRAILITVLSCLPLCARAQATPFVQPEDRVYRDIDRLAAAGLIDTLLVGARPFSEREILRLLGEARRNLDRSRSGKRWAGEMIEADVARFTRARAQVRPFDELRAEGLVTDSPFRGVPEDDNGRLDAEINPLKGNRGGRKFEGHANGLIESRSSATLGSHVAAMLNPRVTAAAGNQRDADLDFAIQSASLGVLFGNVAIEAGRDYTIFGQSPTGGLLVSQNAPTMDLVRISNDAPFTLPWILRVFGPMRASAFVAELGGRAQLHPHAKLAGYHIAALPHPRFEVGVEVIDAMGGEGGEPASFGDRVVDVVPLIDALFRSGSDFQFSNKMAGLDFHWRMPSWRGFELYAEGDVDDFDIRRARSSLLEDGGIIAGTSFSCLMECGRFGIRAEYRQTGIRYYTHSDYPLERQGVILGDPLGPRGLSGALTLDGESSAGYFALQGTFEVRSGNQYGSVTNGPNTEGFHFVLVKKNPAEKRSRLVGTWELDQGRRKVGVVVSAGVERVTNFAFAGGDDRTNGLARVGFTVRP
jgi:hypothetical protein